MEQTDLSVQFAEDIVEGCVVTSVGSKGAGKTSFMLAVLRACLEADEADAPFEEYVLILPSYKVEADAAYHFLSEFDNVTIYTKYHEQIAVDLYKRNHNNKTRKSTLFVVDDATAFAKDLHNGKQSELVGLISESRHVRVTTWLLVHSLRGILSPVMRENVKYLLLYSITNRKLIETIHEEYVSLYKTVKEFIEEYVAVSRDDLYKAATPD